MNERKWFAAAEAKSPEVRHLRNHKRLGVNYTRCGKVIAFDFIVRKEDRLRGCKVCYAECLSDVQEVVDIIEKRSRETGRDTTRDDTARGVIKALFYKGFEIRRRYHNEA